MIASEIQYFIELSGLPGKKEDATQKLAAFLNQSLSTELYHLIYERMSQDDLEKLTEMNIPKLEASLKSFWSENPYYFSMNDDSADRPQLEKLSRKSFIHKLVISGLANKSDLDLSPLKSLTQLTGLKVEEPLRVTWSSLSSLSGKNPPLTSLSLDLSEKNRNVTKEEVQTLVQKFPGLVELRLASTVSGFDQEKMKEIGKLSSLKVLELAIPKNQESILTQLTALRNLEELRVSNDFTTTQTTPLSFQTMAALASLPKLKFLDLALPVAPDAMVAFQGKDLQALSLGSIGVLSSKDVGAIASLNKLQALKVPSEKQVVENFEIFQVNGGLQKLIIQWNNQHVQSFAPVFRDQALKHLLIRASSPTNRPTLDQILQGLTGQYRHIRSLNISLKAPVTAQAMNRLVQHFPLLEELELSFANDPQQLNVEDDVTLPLGRLQGLKKLRTNLSLKPKTAAALASLTHLTELKFGTVSQEAMNALSGSGSIACLDFEVPVSYQLNGQKAAEALSRMKPLEELTFGGNYGFLSNLGKCPFRLKKIYARKITSQGISDLDLDALLKIQSLQKLELNLGQEEIDLDRIRASRRVKKVLKEEDKQGQQPPVSAGPAL